MRTEMRCRAAAGVIALVTLAASLAACQTNPLTGRSQLLLVSEQQAQSASAKAYTTTLQQSRGKGHLDSNPAQSQRIKAITDRLIAQAVKLRPESAAWKWDVHVIDDAEVNAWCMAGGKMAMYSGLLQRLKPSDDEIAQVMGHEISHALLMHTREQMSRALATEAGLEIGSILSGVDLTSLESVANVALLLPNSRQAESEADRLGIELAARAGYDPNAAIALWTKMSHLGGGKPPQWLSTHPSDQTRIDDLQKLVPQMMAYYQAAQSMQR
ncbi:MAG TPA: M48 family metallopeptidase [Burkholderiales bacterium]|nr:M48 family metallopeptidase [Burkholderiales bacterium]